MVAKARNLEQKAFEEAKARERKNIIQAQKMQAAQQRDMDFQDRQRRTKMQLEEKLNKEAEDQRLYELQVAQMEKEELELIMRLKNTKLLEDAANNDLQQAYTDPNPGQRLQAQQQVTGSAKGKRNMAGSRSGNTRK